MLVLVTLQELNAFTAHGELKLIETGFELELQTVSELARVSAQELRPELGLEAPESGLQYCVSIMSSENLLIERGWAIGCIDTISVKWCDFYHLSKKQGSDSKAMITSDVL